MIKVASQQKSVGYYSLLGFEQEPFATSPDPEFFYHTKEHDQALTNLLIELRLRRGLSVIFGDVGTGKTTLCRKLLHELNKRGDMLFHMILDPSFNSEEEFLISLIRNYNMDIPEDIDPFQCGVMELKDIIERFLIYQTLEKGRTIVLLIDEAQKLDLTTLENLRILLNFETNDHKLIQLVLLGQLELYSKVIHMDNFMDRISFKFTLNPLDVLETADLIEYRMLQAGYRAQEPIFRGDAVSEIYNATKGYPRKINMLCHKILKALVMDDVKEADGSFVRSVIAKDQEWLRESVLGVEKTENIV